MAENDEPLDDLRAVTMTAGAAAARVVETLVRDEQNRTRDAAQAAEDAHRRASAQADLAAAQPSAALVYDSPQRRDATNQAMRAAGVPDEVRQAAVTADLLNGADPKLAAAAGPTATSKVKTTAKTSQRERGR